MIACHSLTPASHGNATGMGLADVVTRRLADAIDHDVTRTNVVTSGFLLRGKLPVVADDDRQAWELCLRGAGVIDPTTVRAARIADTLHCSDLWVTDAVWAELERARRRRARRARRAVARPRRPPAAVLELIARRKVGNRRRTGIVQDHVMIRPPSCSSSPPSSDRSPWRAAHRRVAPVPSTPPPSVAVSTSTFGPIAPPPAEVLDATVVYFDPDGTDRQRDLPPPGVIADEPALEAFRQRFVDGDPGLGDDAVWRWRAVAC